jgi:hypothetical protein
MSDLEFTDYLGVRTLGMCDGAFVLELDLGSAMSRRVCTAACSLLLDTALGRAVVEGCRGRGRGSRAQLNFRPVQFGTVRASDAHAVDQVAATPRATSSATRQAVARRDGILHPLRHSAAKRACV